MTTCAHTTTMLDGLLSQEDAARALARLGVEFAVDDETAAVDYRRLLFAMDKLFVNGYSTSALAGFLETPQARFDWRTPAEVAGDPDGIERVRDLIAETVSARRRRHLAVG